MMEILWIKGLKITVLFEQFKNFLRERGVEAFPCSGTLVHRLTSLMVLATNQTTREPNQISPSGQHGI